MSIVGYEIRKKLELINQNQRWLAKSLNISEKHMSRIINGYASLTFPMCYKLSQYLGGSMIFWAGLECDRFLLV